MHAALHRMFRLVLGLKTAPHSLQFATDNRSFVSACFTCSTLTIPVIARKFGLHPQTIFKICKAAGLVRNGIEDSKVIGTLKATIERLVRELQAADERSTGLAVQLDELQEKLNSFSFRVTKDECLDLPDKVYTRRDVELTAEQKKYYDQMKLMALALVDGNLMSTNNALTQTMR